MVGVFLTARPSIDDEAACKHALYGHVDLNAAYSVGDWLRDIAPLLDGPDRPIIVGGTGLYFKALTQGLVNIPPIPIDIKAESQMLLDNGQLSQMIEELDINTKSHIDLQNPMRVQRAWQVWRATGRAITDWHAETPEPLLPTSATVAIHMHADTDWLNHRISQRFNIMINNGALEEAEKILPDWHSAAQSANAIGAAQLIAYLQGQMSLDDAQSRSIIATRQFAKTPKDMVS